MSDAPKVLVTVYHLTVREAPYLRRLERVGFEVVRNPLGRHYTEPNHAGWYRIALGVDDTRDVYTTMSAKGWTFDRPPMLISLDGTPVPDMWITFTSDPDGVPFELVQRPRSAFTERSA